MGSRYWLLRCVALSILLLPGCRSRCPGDGLPDVGQGFEAAALHAPWSGLDNETRFNCHSTTDRFFFRFEVTDPLVYLTKSQDDPTWTERDVDPEDRVEIFFAADPLLKRPYYCAEIDPLGRVMDYRAERYRKFDFDWDFRTLEVRSELTPWGYRVGGSVSREELLALGMDLTGGFCLGVFQGDASEGEGIVWYSLVPAEDEKPDFHQPSVFLPCRMTSKEERRGVVLYPGDVTSLGAETWERLFQLGGIRTLGLHAATSNDPIDSLEAFIRSRAGQDFLQRCEARGIQVEYELHAIGTLLPRELYDSHPAYFRMDEKGERVADYNFCFTSVEALEAMRPQLERLLSWMRPSSHRYFLWPDDKEHKYCHCPRCRDYSPSEQTLIFENRLLTLLREYDPQATLAHLAYHQTLPSPRKVRSEEGIFLEYAPILRDYADPLPEEQLKALQDNLLSFPQASQHILEYWLDESMNARWKRDRRPLLRFDPAQCARDVALYRSLGATSITCFATWLDGSYVAEHGPTDTLFRGYAAAFARE